MSETPAGEHSAEKGLHPKQPCATTDAHGRHVWSEGDADFICPGIASCECSITPESTWLSAASCGYGGGYEPGSQMEWNPDCPAHPPAQATEEALRLALRILAPGDDDNLTLGDLRKEHGIRVFPSDDPRPCKGRNTNVCVGEGCYGEACVTASAETAEGSSDE